MEGSQARIRLPGSMFGEAGLRVASAANLARGITKVQHEVLPGRLSARHHNIQHGSSQHFHMRVRNTLDMHKGCQEACSGKLGCILV